jgi:hypothetical protein
MSGGAILCSVEPFYLPNATEDAVAHLLVRRDFMRQTKSQPPSKCNMAFHLAIDCLRPKQLYNDKYCQRSPTFLELQATSV